MNICAIPRALLLGAVAAAIFAPSAGAQQWENPKAKVPPRAKPNRQSAAEGLPPLPLPATPLRRSERKRQPAPPTLVGMINFSQKEFEIVQGRRREVSTFPTTRIDIEQLMRFANHRLRVRYRFQMTDPGRFSWDPAEIPLLYVTGWTQMPQLSDALLGRLRRYLYDGGTLVVHAQCGREAFRTSARKQINRLFPQRQLARVDMDSPLFNAYYKIQQMRYRVDDKPFVSREPYLEALYLGCRPAVIFSPIDLNCGWDVVKNPIQGGVLYHQNDALQLGLNIITVCLANFQYARSWGVKKVYHEADDATRDQLVIAQLTHEGDWDPTPHALPNLMKYIQQNTTLNVQFKRETMDLSSVDVFRHPVLYMTGLREFQFSQVQVQRLRSYLKSGGVLIADAAAGRVAFDAAFRKQIGKVLPGAELKILPLESPVYQMPFKIGRVAYTERAKAQHEGLNVPALHGIFIDGQLAVVYSPLSLANGWEQMGFAYNRGYADADALRLGVNIIAYALTH